MNNLQNDIPISFSKSWQKLKKKMNINNIKLKYEYLDVFNCVYSKSYQFVYKRI